MIKETDKDVLVIPDWMILALGNESGELIHPSSNSKLKATVDPDGDNVLSIEVLTDPDWEFLDTITNPDGETKQIRDFLGIKKYKYEIVDIF